MKKVKLFSVLLCLVMVLAMFSACNRGQGGDATPAPTQSAGATADPREAEYAVLKAGDEVRFYHWWLPEGVEEFSGDDVISIHRREVINMLKDKYDVTVTIIPFIADGFKTVLDSAYSGNPVADGMHCGGPNGTLGAYYVNDAPASAIVALSDYPVDFTDEQYYDQDAQRIFGTFNNKLYFFVNYNTGISTQQVVYVNYDLFQASGFQVPQLLEWVQNGEWTWDKFREVAKTCTNVNENYWGVGRFHVVEDLLTSVDGYVIKEEEIDGVKRDRFAGSSDQYLSAYNFVKQLYEDQSLAPYDVASDEGSLQKSFQEGELTFMFNYVNRTPTLIETAPELNYGFTLVPKGPNMDKYISEENWFDPFCAFRGSKNTAGAIKVMKELYTMPYGKDSQQAKDLIEADLGALVKDAQSKTILDMVKGIRSYRKTHTYEGLYYTIVHAKVLDDILTGQITAKAYLDSVTDSFNAEIDRLNGIQ